MTSRDTFWLVLVFLLGALVFVAAVFAQII